MPIIKKGDKYNRLTAIKFSHRNKWYEQFWLFKCDCGNEKNINVSNVRNETTMSCGCLGKERRMKAIKNRKTHRMSNTKIYTTWERMKARCLNKNYHNYKDYGGRGITVCDEWMEFENFYKDMGNKPEGKSIDRINNDGNYCKENCKWSTPKEQNNNSRNNHLLTYKGKTLTISQWAEKTGIKYGTLKSRINSYNWSIKKALTTPPRI